MIEDVIVNQSFSYAVRTYYSSNIYAARNGIITMGKPKPWDEMEPLDGADYDYLFWIDSDSAFGASDVHRLLSHGEDVVSGVVPITYNQQVPFGYYGENDNGEKCLKYFNVNQLPNVPTNDKGLIEVDFCGFAFICVKRGVFEKVGYPWFREVNLWHGNMQVRTSEDTAFAYNAKQAGCKVQVDPMVRIGHEKSVLIHPGLAPTPQPDIQTQLIETVSEGDVNGSSNS